MKNKWLITGAALLALSVGSISPNALAESDGVKVQVPSFPVKINGTKIDNNHAPYPLLIYKDITYFPMTWDYARGLGLSIRWRYDQGLDIQNQGTTLNELRQELYANNNTNMTYSAVLPSYPIKVNGKDIDNAKEPYPVLNFRNITYFPMTWRFAHDEFHMLTSWSSTDGFGIVTQQQKIIQDIVFDDADFLYLASSNTLKVNKSLAGTLVKLTQAEEQDLYKKISDKQQNLPGTELKNQDGSSWVIRSAPEEVSVRNSDLRGELTLINAKGAAALINDQLKVHDIQVVRAESDGSIVIRAYNRLSPNQENGAHGIYRIGTDGNAEKWSDLSGRAYSDRNGDVYVLDRKLNKITNITKGYGQTWFDYELFSIISK